MTFLRSSRAIIDTMHRDYPLLTNVADQRNTIHLRWLEWLGFNFTRLLSIGDHAFIQFMRTAYV